VSVVSEQAVLGHCLWNPADARQLLGVVEPGMFVGPGHPSVGALVLAMLDASLPVEPGTVASRLLSGPAAHLYQPNPSAWLHTLLQAAPRDINGALWHAGEVRKAATLRDGWRDAQRVADILRDPEDPELALSGSAAELRTVADRMSAAATWEANSVPHLGDLLRERPPPTRWRVPNLLSERDKMIWTGLEGLGKTELGAQLAACAAAGMQPFTGELHEPQTVLIYDLENERDALLRRYWRICRAVNAALAEDFDWSRIHLRSVEAGIDITRADDFARLRRDVDATRPGILLIGPLSKIARGHNLNDEEVAVGLCGRLDELRVEHNLCTLTEAHSAKEKDGNGKRLPAPRGSSYFLGWPVSGFGLRVHEENGEQDPARVLELKQFRGSREERWWPDGLIRLHGTDEFPALPFGAKWKHNPPHLRAVSL
jgi:RecA-family ATPase